MKKALAQTSQTRIDELVPDQAIPMDFCCTGSQSIPCFFEGGNTYGVALPGQSIKDRVATYEDMASRLKKKALQLCRKVIWDGPGVVLKNICNKIPFRELEVGKSGSYWTMINPIVKPHFDRKAIPKFPYAATLEIEGQGPDPLPNIGSFHWVSRTPNGGTFEVSGTKPLSLERIYRDS